VLSTVSHNRWNILPVDTGSRLYSKLIVTYSLSSLLIQCCVGDKIEKNEMGAASRAVGGGERRVEGFGGDPEGKGPLGRPRCR
jgi:hypothetical protein